MGRRPGHHRLIGRALALSHRVSYHGWMAVREKRSISLPPEVAAAIDEAAEAAGTNVSAWITATVVHRLRIDAGRAAVAEWEREHGALTTEELADGLARARALLAAEDQAQHAS